MKKILLLCCLVLCGCRSLPASTYTFKATEKNDNYRYMFNNSYLSTFEKEVLYALHTRGPKIGTIKFSDHTIDSGSVDNALWLPPTILTFGIINLTGWPAYHQSITVHVKAEVYDNYDNLVDTYTAIASDWSFAACYYGFGPIDAHTRAYNGAYRKALKQVLADIHNDKELPNTLKALADKKNKEQKKKEAAMKSEKEKKEAEKKQHLNNVMTDLENL